MTTSKGERESVKRASEIRNLLDSEARRPNLIAEMLAANGMTVLQVAAKAEISFSVLSDMAAKRYGSDVSLARARRIARALGETVDAVFPPTKAEAA